MNVNEYIISWFIKELTERNTNWREVRQNFQPRPPQQMRLHLPRTKVRF